MSFSTSPQGRLRAFFLALAVAALAVMATASSASAAPATGEVVLTLKKGAQSSLMREGVKVTPSGGSAKARTVKLAVADLDLASGAIKTGAALTLSANGKSVKLSDVLVSVGGKSTAVTAKQGGKRKVFFRLQGNSTSLASSLDVSGPLTLTGAGVKALRTGLGLEGLSGGKVGSGSANASISQSTPVPAPPAPKPTLPEPPVDPYASTCAVPAGEDPSFGTPPADANPPAADPVLDGPQAVAGGSADWGFRTSFRNYVTGTQDPGSAGSIAVLDDAIDNAGVFRFSGDGEYVRHQNADDDQLVLSTKGTVVFCKAAHGFYAVLKDPKVVIDGASSRIVAEIGLNRGGTWLGFRTADIAKLDVSSVQPTYSADGKTATWTAVPAKLTADGAAISGLYPENAVLDPITVSAPVETVPDVFSETCGPFTNPAVAAGPELPEAPIALPTLNVTTATAGGSVVWGIHTPFRNQILSNTPPGATGTLQALEGASYADPAFTYPEGSGSYEQGVFADPADDRLILNAGGIALLCKPTHGYRYAISNPTVVIDGVNSRLVVDTDLRINGLIDPNVRSDFASLNMTGITPTVVGGTITWSNIPVTLTQNGSEALNGRYAAGTVLDPITVSAELP
jgi:hypothetical protein